MGNFISKGLVGFASETEGKVWCMSHHAVYHPNKPAKIRVMFDGSAEFNGKFNQQRIDQWFRSNKPFDC